MVKRLYQIGTSNIKYDLRYKAKKPGRRRSEKSGRIYYEYRRNRSDLKGRL